MLSMVLRVIAITSAVQAMRLCSAGIVSNQGLPVMSNCDGCRGSYAIPWEQP
jgi:hypothetical protein